MEGKQKKSKK